MMLKLDMFCLLIASDNEALINSVKISLIEKKDLYIANCPATLNSINEYAKVMPPNFLLLDLMSDFEGKLHMIDQVKNHQPELHVIGLSDSSDQNKIVRTFRAGVEGFLVREGIFHETYRCLLTILQGEKYLSLHVISKVLDHLIKTPHLDPQRPDLVTKREKEHIICIAQGMNPKEIAFKMKISKKTADNYRNRIMKKLNLNSIADIVKYAIKEQFITL